MLLNEKTAIIYGADSAIGAASARLFAREGARVFLAAPSRAKLDAVAAEIAAAGGTAEIGVLDCLDAVAVDQHAEMAAAKAGRIDIALNAVGIAFEHGVPFAELSYESFNVPISGYLKTLFITSQAVVPHMVRQGAGVILSLSAPVAKLSGAGFLGHGVASAAVEAFTRILAGELGTSGIRALCIRPHAIPEDTNTTNAFGPMAERLGVTVDQLLDGMTATTLLKRLPTLDQVANTAAFLASDRAGAMTGTIANLTAGYLVD